MRASHETVAREAKQRLADRYGFDWLATARYAERWQQGLRLALLDLLGKAQEARAEGSPDVARDLETLVAWWRDPLRPRNGTRQGV